jgi:putative phosphoribosyl transferase
VIVRKVGVPGHQELAMGAVASGGFEVRNEDVMRRLGITTETFERVAGRERSELERRTTRYRADRAQPSLEGRDIVVVDDGIATGASMGVALRSIRTARPGSLWVAVPVAPPSAVEHLATMADGFTAVIVDDAFGAVGRWYEDFSQTSDAEVEALLSG